MAVDVKENILLAPYTIYKIGGAARYFTEAKNADDLREALAYASEKAMPFFILGAGSNVLIADKGYGGMVIRMTGGETRVEGERLVADSGVMMARAAAEVARHGLTGFEWGIGVPGSIGGSVRGNAGCFGREMKDAVESVRVANTDRGKPDPDESGSGFLIFKNSDCEFGYRDSIFKKHPEWVVLSTTIKLEKGDPTVIQERIRQITVERLTKQAIGTKSCGCIFKNILWEDAGAPREDFIARFPALAAFADRAAIPASYLIDSAGLKGRREGGAMISPTHANFFINEGAAVAEDIVRLVARAKDAVREKYGIALHEEIQYVGF